MGSMAYFFWLSGQALEAPLLFPGLSLLAMIVGFAALAGGCASGQMFRRRTLVLLVPCGIPLVILVCGAALKYDGPDFGPPWHAGVIHFLLWFHVPLAAFLIWWLRGMRWAVLGLSFFQWWMSLCAAVVSFMSVTGDWL